MVSVDKSVSKVYGPRDHFKKFCCLTKHDCIVNFVNFLIEWVYLSHDIQRNHILCYFEKQIGSGSTLLLIFGTGI